MRDVFGKIEVERVYQTREVAEMLGVDISTVRYWIKKGWLEGIRIGGRFRVRGEALVKFLERGAVKR